MMKIDTPRLIDLPKIIDNRGNLTFAEANNHIPFEIRRVYWIYDVPGGAMRGGHAFYENREVVIALSGSLDVVLNNGQEELRFSLNRSYYGLYVPNLYWRYMDNFSTNSVALVLSSNAYSENDYIFDQVQFKLLANGR
jgi:oxalate decarboxylase/phosphoglucose isomerase-like protein (cupin superfamily)